MRRFKLNFGFGLGKGVHVSSPPTTFHIEDFVKPIGNNQFVSSPISDKNFDDSKSFKRKLVLVISQYR